MKQIDLTIAQQMVDRYQTTRKKLIDSNYGINDTKSITFDIASMRDFINNLPAETTAVRVYLAAYDDTDASAPNQTTVVLIGTVDKEGSDIDAILDSTVLVSGLEALNQGKNCPPICP